jgi:hypothetical protein
LAGKCVSNEFRVPCHSLCDVSDVSSAPQEEEIQASIRMQDEIVAKKLAEKERKRIEDHRHQVQEDARLARQAE